MISIGKPYCVTALHNNLIHVIIVGFFISVSTCISEWVFSHLEGMCSDCK